MRDTISMIRAACLPFVTRTFRGPRARRYLTLTLVLGILSGLLGAWFAQGSGPFERDVREAVGLETNRYEREHTEFLIFAGSVWEYEALAEARTRALAGHTDEYGQVVNMQRQAAATLWAASMTQAPAGHAELSQRANALLQDQGVRMLDTDAYNPGFSWYETRDVQRLQSIVDRELVPAVMRYETPLGWRGTFQMIGLVSGGCIVVFMLVGAPLLAGVQIAQEVHENTLQPLTGTRLSSRQLVVGLASGPLALAGLLAAPQAVLFGTASIAAGHGLAAIGFLVVTTASTLLLVVLASLVGFVSGRKRAPGMVGMGLALLLGGCFFAGTGLGMAMEGEIVGTVSVIPQAGAMHLLREAFAPAYRLDELSAHGIDLRLAFSTLSSLVLAGIAGLALQRRLSGRAGPSLRRVEAVVGAAVLSWMALLTLPPEAADEAEAIYLVSLAMLIVPAQLLLMARVHLSEDPSSRRTIPLASLMAEFFGFFALHLGFALVLVGGPAALWPLSAGGILHLAWGLSVAGLVAVRATAVPLKLPALVWVGLCMAMIAFEVGLGVMLSAMAHDGHFMDIEVFPMFEASPLLGLLHVGLFLATPVLLVSALRKASAGLR